MINDLVREEHFRGLEDAFADFATFVGAVLGDC